VEEVKPAPSKPPTFSRILYKFAARKNNKLRKANEMVLKQKRKWKIKALTFQLDLKQKNLDVK